MRIGEGHMVVLAVYAGRGSLLKNGSKRSRWQTFRAKKNLGEQEREKHTDVGKERERRIPTGLLLRRSGRGGSAEKKGKKRKKGN